MGTSIHDRFDPRAFPPGADPVEAICAPYITSAGLAELRRRSEWRAQGLRVLTDVDPGSIAAGVLDPAALRALMGEGAEVRHLCHLHAKIYLCAGSAYAGSANLTRAAIHRNHEVMVQVGETAAEPALRALFERYWAMAVLVSEEFLRSQEEAAEALREIQLDGDSKLVLAWFQQFVLVEAKAIILEKLDDLELDPHLLGFEPGITQGLRKASRVAVRTLGQALRKEVRNEAEEHKRAATSHLQTWEGRECRLLPMMELSRFDEACQAWQLRLRELVREKIRAAYSDLREDAWRNCRTTVTSLGEKRGRPIEEEAWASIRFWFESSFPRLEALEEDARVEVVFSGLHPVQFEKVQGLRSRVLDRIRAPLQPRLPGLAERPAALE